jgi:cytochrome c-type biogenesis protein CcmH
MPGRISLSAILFLLLAPFAGPIFSPPDTEAALRREDLNPDQEKLYRKVGTELVCQCGCLSPIGSCPHAQCGFGVPFKQEIFQKIVDGAGHQEILDHFVEKYGLKILAAPPKRGFNLVAGWSFPLLVVGSLGAVVAFLVRRWTAWSADESSRRNVPERPAPDGDKYRTRLQKELEEFER